MTNEPAAPCDLCCHRHTGLQGEPDVGGNPGEAQIVDLRGARSDQRI